VAVVESLPQKNRRDFNPNGFNLFAPGQSPEAIFNQEAGQLSLYQFTDSWHHHFFNVVH
jgi:hypothetical protein